MKNNYRTSKKVLNKYKGEANDSNIQSNKNKKRNSKSVIGNRNSNLDQS
jgi:hypothetical protein